ncbi:hypothetical protein BIW11_03111 [Tropilaelaps mercedesae]|uniref:Uncharacterized protein n=1 Tax=Tropilaelaps mercedesae TaxID=418985 RepID=A0A1V9XS94_9ACAR|nr:hypothetical protein BIW11_03111 [Tropilaelaps mercedesae]
MLKIANVVVSCVRWPEDECAHKMVFYFTSTCEYCGDRAGRRTPGQTERFLWIVFVSRKTRLAGSLSWGQTLDDMPPDLITDCAQLVKLNSKQVRKPAS